jgi:Glycosyl transferase family 2
MRSVRPREVPRLTRHALDVVRDEGWRSLVARGRRFLLGSQAQVFRDYRRWLRQPPPVHTRSAAADATLVSVVVPVCDPPPALLTDLLGSLRAQSHPGWELCLADDASQSATVQRLLRRAVDEGQGRVRLAPRSERRRGIALTTNAALDLARGEVVAFLDHDDRLAPDALARAAGVLAAEPTVGLAYSDEDKLDMRGRRTTPFFKPAFDPVLHLACNYMSHLLVARRGLIEEVGRLRPEFDGSQDYDLALRLCERTERVAHLPHVLYHWRQVPGSVAHRPRAKEWAYEAARHALEAALARRGLAGRVEPGPWLGSYRALLEPPAEPAEVSAVVSADAPPAWLAAAGVGEVLCAGSGQAAAREACADRARGRYLLLVGDVSPRRDPRAALEALLGLLAHPGVAIASGKLLRGDHAVVEHGLALGHGAGGVAAFLESGAWPHDPGYFGLLSVPRSVSAVGDALLLIERSLFEDLGGLRPDRFPSAGGGVDLCRRAALRGLRAAVTPEAVFSLPAGQRVRHDYGLDAAGPALRAEHGPGRVIDPFFNPNFLRGVDTLRLSAQPADLPFQLSPGVSA